MHTGPLGINVKIGRYFMMAAFGAGFGMLYISKTIFLLNAINYLLTDWLGIL